MHAYVPVRVTVDANGDVTECVVQLEQVMDEFKKAVCDGLTRGYDPALDSEGKPVASMSRTSVIYAVN